MVNNDSSKLASDEYDQIAVKYQEATKRPSRKYILEPSFVKFLGDLSRKRVLDLACGEGYSSRLSLSLGAREVVGVDISAEEIRMAKEIGNPSNKGNLEYFVEDAAGEMGDYGKFDVVTAIMLINYCSSRELIDKILKNVKKYLKNGGRFITTLPNWDFDKYFEGYGVKMLKEGEEEGSKINTMLYNFETGEDLCSFTKYYWARRTYSELFCREWI